MIFRLANTTFDVFIVFSLEPVSPEVIGPLTITFDGLTYTGGTNYVVVV